MKELSLWAFGVLIGCMVMGCGTLTPPPQYVELKTVLDSEKAKASSYDAARRHLQAADEALEKRDAPAVKRFSSLGIIETQIADAQLFQMELVEAIETRQTQLASLEKDVTLWKSRVDQLLAEQARLAMRGHIEKVIDKETLTAAAMEELQVDSTDTSDVPLRSARRKVAAELIAMARVRLQVASLLVAAQSVMAEQISGLNGALALMETALADDDIPSVYQYGERSLAQYVSVIDAAWTASGQAREAARDALIDELKNRGLNVLVEDAGLVLSADLTAEKRSVSLTPARKKMFAMVADVMKRKGDVAVVAVISGGSYTKDSREQAAHLAMLIREEFSSLGVTDQNFAVLRFSNERPVLALKGTGIQMALIFVPVP